MRKELIIAVAMLMSIACNAQEVKLPAPNTARQTLTLMQSLKQRKSMREFSQQPLSQQDLSDLLWAAQGVNRDNGNLTAATAMNRQEVRAYVFDSKGVSLYNPKTNTLTEVVSGDHRDLMTAGQAFARTAPVTILLVVDFQKFGSTGERAQWLTGVDVGIVSENIYLFAAATGMNTVARAMMDAPAISKLLNLTDRQVPVLNHPVGYSLSKTEAVTPAEDKTIYDFDVKNQKMEDVSLSAYKGKVLLVVNTASHCGFTPQYKELEAIYEELHDKGFEILDFPCNQFGSQAPESDADYQAFCQLNYSVKFPQFHKIDVNGENAIPLYTWMKQQTPAVSGRNGQQTTDIRWNFTKFLIDKQGNVVARFESNAKPQDIAPAIKELLAK